MSHPQRNRTIIIVVGSVVLATVACVFLVFAAGLGGIFLLGTMTETSDTPDTFDAAAWQQYEINDAEERRSRLRCSMVGDLMENHLSVGMSKREVVALLGEPDTLVNDNQQEFLYVLGICSVIDYDELRLTFDANDQLVEYSQVPG